jgi:hypothetical protein
MLDTVTTPVKPLQHTTRVWDLTPLHHPLWWAALALLLFNDNVLKGAGIVPAWLTGKLSDFAFLIVAPVLLATLLPRAVPWRRAIAVLAVVLVYAAADLSPAVSDAIVAAASRAGLSWKLWPDVTDLLALVVLPLTWKLLRPSPPRPPVVAPPGRRLLESAAVCIGALACLATSDYDHGPPQKPFVVNQTTRPRTVTTTWLLRTLPCNDDLTAVAASLTSGDLGDARSATVASGTAAILEVGAPPVTNVAESCQRSSSHAPTVSGRSGGCLGVIVEATDGPTVLARFPIAWYGDYVGSCRSTFSLGENPGPRAIALRERGGQLVLSVDPESPLRVATVSRADIASRPAGSQSCAGLLAEQDQLSNAASSCARDADCLKQPALPVPGDDCAVHGNRELTPAATQDLRRRWVASSCIVDDNFERACHPVQPAVCVAGRCQAICAGVDLPICPDACYAGFAAGASCSYEFSCSPADGTWCRCDVASGTVKCQPPPRPPGCLLSCIPRNNPNTPPPAVPDAAPADAQPDAGGSEAQ